MKIPRRLVFAGAFALAAAVAAGLIVSASWLQGAAGSRQSQEALLDPAAPLDETLTAAGFPSGFVNAVSKATTQLTSSTPGRYRVLQRIPALSLRRDIRIAVHEGKRLLAERARPLKTVEGFDVYPLHHDVIGFKDGYDRYQAFFVAYDGLPAELRDQLGLQRRASRRWNIMPVAYAQSALLGVVVASVTTTTGDSGVGDTFRPAPEGGMDSGTTHPGAPAPEPSLEELRQGYLDTHYEGSQEAYNQQYQESQRRFTESLDPETRSRLQQPENLSFEHARGEVELGNLLREGETLAQQEARVRVQRDAARLQNVGNAVAVLSMLAEWMQQALDLRDWGRQLDAAEACLDQRAQNAGPAERENIELVRMQLRAARSDLNWNTGVRVLNSANSSAGSIAMAGAAGGVFGLASSGNNAGLRDLTGNSVSDALRGVGNCDPPPPCPQLPQDAPPTELLHTPANQQTHTPGPAQASAPAPVCTGPRAVIVMRYREKMENWSNTITFQAAVDISNFRRVQMGATTVDYPERDFRGTGPASYQQAAALTGQKAGCNYSLTRSGQPRAEVWVQTDNREASVKLLGELQTREQTPDPNESCGAPGAPPLLECYFFDLNLERGGVFKADDMTDFYNGPNDFKDFECTLTLSPLDLRGAPREPAPVGAVAPGADPRRR